MVRPQTQSRFLLHRLSPYLNSMIVTEPPPSVGVP